MAGNAAAVTLNVFLHFYGIRAVWYDRAGHDAYTFARANDAGKGSPGDGFADEGQGISRSRGEGVTIHRGYIRHRQFQRRNHVFCQHTPAGGI